MARCLRYRRTPNVMFDKMNACSSEDALLRAFLCLCVRGLVQTALAVKCVLVCDIRLINIVIERSCTLSRLSSECVWYQPNKRYTFTPFILLHPFAVSGCFQGFGAQLHRRPVKPITNITTSSMR